MHVSSFEVQRRIEDYLGRYEFVEGKSAKFWECLKDGDTVGKYATRWGSIKATKTKHNIKPNMDSWAAAEKIAEKINKGYRLVQHNPIDVMNLRVATEEAELLRKTTKKIKASEPEEDPTPSPRRRL